MGVLGIATLALGAPVRRDRSAPCAASGAALLQTEVRWHMSVKGKACTCKRLHTGLWATVAISTSFLGGEI